MGAIKEIKVILDVACYCIHCGWTAGDWIQGQPKPRECHHCKDATPEQREARKALVHVEGRKYAAAASAARALRPEGDSGVVVWPPAADDAYSRAVLEAAAERRRALA